MLPLRNKIFLKYYFLVIFLLLFLLFLQRFSDSNNFLKKKKSSLNFHFMKISSAILRLKTLKKEI